MIKSLETAGSTVKVLYQKKGGKVASPSFFWYDIDKGPWVGFLHDAVHIPHNISCFGNCLFQMNDSAKWLVNNQSNHARFVFIESRHTKSLLKVELEPDKRRYQQTPVYCRTITGCSIVLRIRSPIILKSEQSLLKIFVVIMLVPKDGLIFKGHIKCTKFCVFLGRNLGPCPRSRP